MPERKHTEEGFGEIREESTCAGASVPGGGRKECSKFKVEQNKPTEIMKWPMVISVGFLRNRTSPTSFRTVSQLHKVKQTHYGHLVTL